MTSFKEDNIYRIYSNGEIRFKDTNKKVETTISKSNRELISLHGTVYQLHYVIYKVFKGPVPSNYKVAHLNGFTTDNQLQNLAIAPVGKVINHQNFKVLTQVLLKF